MPSKLRHWICTWSLFNWHLSLGFTVLWNNKGIQKLLIVEIGHSYKNVHLLPNLSIFNSFTRKLFLAFMNFQKHSTNTITTLRSFYHIMCWGKGLSKIRVFVFNVLHSSFNSLNPEVICCTFLLRMTSAQE